jgi:hypothetical protein
MNYLRVSRNSIVVNIDLTAITTISYFSKLNPGIVYCGCL